MESLSLTSREWPTRIAGILQALAMGTVITIVLAILFL